MLLPEAAPSTRLLTVGRRCAREGFGFYWYPWMSRPRFVKPSGEDCNVWFGVDYMPHLVSTSRPTEKPNKQRHIFVGTRADDGGPEGLYGEPPGDEVAAYGWMPSAPQRDPGN